MAAITTNENFIERVFETVWEIEDWGNVRQSETLLAQTNIEIQCKADNLEYATFIVGFKFYENVHDRCVGFYWELLHKHHCLHNVEASVRFEVLNGSGEVGLTYKGEAKAVVGSPMVINNNWHFPYRGTPADIISWTTPEGSLAIKLKFTLKNLPNASYFSKASELLKVCKDELSMNLASLLNDELGSDLKILTQDKIELFAHKAILCARCPVFATMIGSDFLEKSTGIVNVEDISAKTMKILLSYWYSGELLPSWKDSDTVVEFIYGAGKYQINNVLKMLDDDYSGLDFQATDGDLVLLKLVHNLSLKNAEVKILKRILNNGIKAESSTDLLKLLPLATGNLNDESFKASEVLKLIDDVLSKQENKNSCSRDIELMTWADNLGLKNVESLLFTRIKNQLKKIVSTDEFFGLN